MPNNSVLITARSNSTRLPEKALRLIAPNTSLIEYCISRALTFVEASKVIVATTEDSSDDFLSHVVLQTGVNVYRGPVEDKIRRWAGAAQQFNCEHIICFDGDDPFTDLQIGFTCADLLSSNTASLVKSVNVPCGSFTYAMDAESLVSLAQRFDTSNSEMMWTYFEDDPSSFIHDYYHTYSRVHTTKQVEIESIRVTVDYEEDINLIRHLITNYTGSGDFSAEHIVSIYLEKPQLFQANSFRQSQFLLNQSRIISEYKK